MRGRDSLTILRIYSLAGSPGVDNGEHTRQVVGLRWPTLCSISREDRSGTRGRLLTVKIVGSGTVENNATSPVTQMRIAALTRWLEGVGMAANVRHRLVVSRIYSLAGSPSVDNDEHTRQVVGLRWPTLCSISREDRGGTRGRLLTVKTIDSGSKDSFVASAARTQVNAALSRLPTSVAAPGYCPR